MTQESLRLIALGTTINFRYLGIQPALSIEELEKFPAPRGIGAKLKNGITLVEEYSDNSTAISFDKKNTPELFDDTKFKAYASEIIEYLGASALHSSEIIKVAPGSIIAQVIDREISLDNLTSTVIFIP